MYFEYEITADDYAAGQVLYQRLKGGRKRLQNAIFWILAGTFFILLAWGQRPPGWAQLLLALFGAHWIYVGIVNIILLDRHFRKFYGVSKLAGEKFKTVLSEDALEVTGDTCSWRFKWPAITLKGESKRVFLFYSHGTIFIFGKKYLNDGQQRELRSQSGLDSKTA